MGLCWSTYLVSSVCGRDGDGSRRSRREWEVQHD